MSRVVGEQRAYVPCGWMLVDAEEACMAGAGRASGTRPGSQAAL